MGDNHYLAEDFCPAQGHNSVPCVSYLTPCIKVVNLHFFFIDPLVSLSILFKSYIQIERKYVLKRV